MNIRDMLLPVFEREMANTRKLLERTPVEKADWKPHAKSMTMGRLAGHLAELPGFAAMIMKQDKLDLTAMVKEGRQPFIAASSSELLNRFDSSVAEARKALESASDQELSKVWSMELGGKTIVSMERYGVFQSIFLNHLVHHRAQLGVYFRLNDIPLPGLYGPSADES